MSTKKNIYRIDTEFCNRFLHLLYFQEDTLKKWEFGLTSNGVLSGLRKYGLPMMLAAVVVSVSFIIGLQPFDNHPSVLRIITEGIIYYVGVGIMEELYLRGLLQNLIEKCFEKERMLRCMRYGTDIR